MATTKRAPTLEIACSECGDELEEGRCCGPCHADELFREFLAAMPEIEFGIAVHQVDVRRIVAECFGGNVRAYFLDSWEHFIASR